MDNKEDILDALEEFGRKSTNDNVPPILEEYLLSIARTGETLFPWCKLKSLFVKKLEAAVADFEEKTPMDSSKELPNVENVCFNDMTERLRNAIAKFNGIPFTIQRLCELVTNPHKHYKKTDKFLRGIEKNVMVVSTVDPHGNKIVNEQKHMMNGIDGANGFAGDMKTPEKLGISLISPTPMNSPVTSHWYNPLSGAGDSVTTHNTWQQQGHPLVGSVPRTAEMACVSGGSRSLQRDTVVMAHVENRTDISDSLANDGHLNEILSSETGVSSTETSVSSVETGAPSTVTVAPSTVTGASTETGATSTETGAPSSVLMASGKEVPCSDVDVQTDAPSARGEGDNIVVAPAENTPQATPSTSNSPVKRSEESQVTTRLSDQSMTESVDQSTTSSVDQSTTDTHSATSLDTNMTTCTSPDSSDAAQVLPGDDSETRQVDAEADECTNAKRPRRDSGGFDTPVIEGRVEGETDTDDNTTIDRCSLPAHNAIEVVAPPDSSNVVEGENGVLSMPVSHSETSGQEAAATSVVNDSVTRSNSKEVEHVESPASSQSSEGSEVVDASPSQSDSSNSGEVTDSSCTQSESSSSSAVGETGDVSSSRHEPMDTD